MPQYSEKGWGFPKSGVYAFEKLVRLFCKKFFQNLIVFQNLKVNDVAPQGVDL
jgi:hypothetical protein